jgi:hypothetical protein
MIAVRVLSWNKLPLRGIPGAVPARTAAASAWGHRHCDAVVKCMTGGLPGLGVRGNAPSHLPVSAG